MKDKGKERIKKTILKWLLSFLPLILALGLYFLAGASVAFSDWYAKNIYPLWVSLWGRLWGFFPFSVNEFAYYLLALLAVYWLIRDFIRIIQKKLSWAVVGNWFRTIILVAGITTLIFMIGSGINFNRETFASEYHLDLSGGSAEDLYYLSEIMMEGMNRLAEQQIRDEEGIMQLSDGIQERTRRAMEKLGTVYPSLSGFCPKAKPVFFSLFLSWENITGLQSPFTVEAQYNRLIVPYNIPHVICHELSHLKGYPREDEANFIGLLACFLSEDADIQYSGYTLGYIYASNALYGADYDRWAELRQGINPLARGDLSANSRYWDQYETKLADIRETINDTQLKINHQEDGVISYGRVVDLLLAYYCDEIEGRKNASGN